MKRGLIFLDFGRKKSYDVRVYSVEINDIIYVNR